MHEHHPGDLVAGYQLTQALGRGGDTWKARHCATGAQVCLRLMERAAQRMDVRSGLGRLQAVINAGSMTVLVFLEPGTSWSGGRARSPEPPAVDEERTAVFRGVRHDVVGMLDPATPPRPLPVRPGARTRVLPTVKAGFDPEATVTPQAVSATPDPEVTVAFQPPPTPAPRTTPVPAVPEARVASALQQLPAVYPVRVRRPRPRRRPPQPPRPVLRVPHVVVLALAVVLASLLLVSCGVAEQVDVQPDGVPLEVVEAGWQERWLDEWADQGAELAELLEDGDPVALLAPDLDELDEGTWSTAGVQPPPGRRPLRMRSGTFDPPAGVAPEIDELLSSPERLRDSSEVYVFIRLDESPSASLRAAVEQRGARVIAAFPRRAWTAAVPVDSLRAVAAVPGIYGVSLPEQPLWNVQPELLRNLEQDPGPRWVAVGLFESAFEDALPDEQPWYGGPHQPLPGVATDRRLAATGFDPRLYDDSIRTYLGLADEQAVRALADRNEVQFIEDLSGPVVPLDLEGGASLGLDELHAWPDPHTGRAYTGRRVRLGMVDTGYEEAHPDLDLVATFSGDTSVPSYLGRAGWGCSWVGATGCSASCDWSCDIGEGDEADCVEPDWSQPACDPWFSSAPPGSATPDPRDHGTRVASLFWGRNVDHPAARGTAAAAKRLFVARVPLGPSNQADGGARLFAGMQYLANGDADAPDQPLRPRVVNMSAAHLPDHPSGNACESLEGITGTDAYSRLVDQAVWYQRQSWVVAAGNYGGGLWSDSDGMAPPFRCGQRSVSSPGSAKNAITAGALYDHGWDTPPDLTNEDPTAAATPHAGYRAPYSSYGPTFDDRNKPDVMLPAEQVTAANPSCTAANDPACATTSTLDSDLWDLDDTGRYMDMNGTSAASPLLAGLVAGLIQDRPGAYRRYPARIKARLRASAVPMRVQQAPSGASYWNYKDQRTGSGSTHAALLHRWREGGVQAMDRPSGWRIGDKRIRRSTLLEHDLWSKRLPEVDSGDTRLVVVLTWDEKAAEPGAAEAVHNDLNLVLCPPGVLYSSGDCYRSDADPDREDNVEFWVVENPQPSAQGHWRAYVELAEIGDAGPNSFRASLSWTIWRGCPRPQLGGCLMTEPLDDGRWRVTAQVWPESAIARSVQARIQVGRVGKRTAYVAQDLRLETGCDGGEYAWDEWHPAQLLEGHGTRTRWRDFVLGDIPWIQADHEASPCRVQAGFVYDPPRWGGKDVWLEVSSADGRTFSRHVELTDHIVDHCEAPTNTCGSW